MTSLLAVVKAADNGWGVVPLVALVAALTLGTYLAHRVYRDLKGESDERLTESDDLLNPLIQAYAAGEMSRDEYLRARAAVARRGFADASDEIAQATPVAEPPFETPARDPNGNEVTEVDARSSEEPPSGV